MLNGPSSFSMWLIDTGRMTACSLGDFQFWMRNICDRREYNHLHELVIPHHKANTPEFIYKAGYAPTFQEAVLAWLDTDSWRLYLAYMRMVL